MLYVNIKTVVSPSHFRGFSAKIGVCSLFSYFSIYLFTYLFFFHYIWRILHPIELQFIPKLIGDGKMHNNGFMVKAMTRPQL